MSDTNERSVASAGSVAWPSVGMISENRLRELMADVGLPYSRSLLAALRQCDMEARLDVAARLRLTDAEREAVEKASAAYQRRMSEPLYVDAAEKRSFADVLEENARLKEAIRRLADQDATLSVQGGNVIVEMDGTRDAQMPSDPFRVDSGPFLGRIIGVEGIASLRLTDEEREAVEWAAATAQESVDKKLMGWEADAVTAATLRGLLERLGGER